MKISFDDTKKTNPTYDEGMKVTYAPAKRIISSWRWYLVVFITASPLVFFLGKILLSYLFNSAPGMVLIKKIDLNSPEAASVSKLIVQRGDEITKDGLIAELYDPAMNEQISVLNAEMLGLQKQLTTEAYDKRLLANLRLAKKILSQQTENLNKIKFLYAKGAATAAELNLARTQSNQAELEVSRALSDIEAADLKMSDRDAKARIDRLKKEIESRDAKTGRLKMTSPVQGVVSEIFVTENQSVSKGSPIARISIPGDYNIKAYVDPSNLKYAKKGKKITLRFPGNTFLKGYVTSDPKEAQKLPTEISESFYETKQTLEVNIKTDEPLPSEFQIDGLPVKLYFGFMFF